MEYVKKYISTQNEVLRYSKLNTDCPVPTTAAAKIALEKLREHLDDLGFRMPNPRYIYNHYDERTWQFLPTDINMGYKNLYVSNPNFIYRAK